jgi:hypothetical protein
MDSYGVYMNPVGVGESLKNLFLYWINEGHSHRGMKDNKGRGAYGAKGHSVAESVRVFAMISCASRSEREGVTDAGVEKRPLQRSRRGLSLNPL